MSHNMGVLNNFFLVNSPKEKEVALFLFLSFKMEEGAVYLRNTRQKRRFPICTKSVAIISL